MSELNLQALGLNLDVVEDEVQSGGGKLPPLPSGTYGARLVGVVEVGQHPGFDKTKTKDEVILAFQLFGKLVPETLSKEGKPIPRTDFFRINKTFNEKGAFLEVFNAMNYKGDAHNFFQLLGRPFRIVRKAYTKQDGTEGVKIHKEGILKPVIEIMDEDGLGTGEFKEIKVPEVTADLMVYQWLTGNQAQFDTLPGFMQKQIKEALNIKGSPAEGLKARESAQEQQGDGAPEEPAITKTSPKPTNKAVAQAEEDFEF